MDEWRRSGVIQYPRIWSKFNALNPANNKIQSFSITDITEINYDNIIKELTRLLTEHTPIEMQPAIFADQVSISEREDWWRVVLDQRLSLMCVLQHPGGSRVIVAVSINARRSLYESQPDFKGKRMSWNWFTRQHIFQKKYFYEEFRVTEAIDEVGGFIIPQFIPTAVSENMFKCRELLCKEIDIKLCFVLLELVQEQNPYLAVTIEAGFKEYIRVPYEEVASIDTTQPLSKCDFYVVMSNFYK